MSELDLIKEQNKYLAEGLDDLITASKLMNEQLKLQANAWTAILYRITEIEKRINKMEKQIDGKNDR